MRVLVRKLVGVITLSFRRYTIIIYKKYQLRLKLPFLKTVGNGLINQQLYTNIHNIVS